MHIKVRAFAGSVYKLSIKNKDAAVDVTELLRRHSAGEWNFTRVDFSKVNLSHVYLVEIDLSLSLVKGRGNGGKEVLNTRNLVFGKGFLGGAFILYGHGNFLYS